MFIVVGFGKTFSKLKVLDTSDNITEELHVTTLEAALNNGLEIYPMYLKLVNVKSIQSGSGYMIQTKDGKRLIVPSAILDQYVSRGLAVVSR